MALLECEVQRSPVRSILRICIRAVLDEEPGQIHKTLFGCPMQWGRPVVALGCHDSAVLDEESGHIQMTPFGCPMQWCRPVLALGCHVGTVLDEEPGHTHMTPS